MLPPDLILLGTDRRSKKIGDQLSSSGADTTRTNTHTHQRHNIHMRETEREISVYDLLPITIRRESLRQESSRCKAEEEKPTVFSSTSSHETHAIKISHVPMRNDEEHFNSLRAMKYLSVLRRENGRARVCVCKRGRCEL